MAAIVAPEFPSGKAWLNTPRALTMRELRGQLVVLDFWTYCCINCMHVLPILRALEEEFAREPFVVIGVHSAKFDGEKDAARIREAMHRYEIAHPVIVDSDMQVWSSYAIRSWPTLVVVRPEGTIAATAPGEPDHQTLRAFLQKELAQARQTGRLARERFALAETGVSADTHGPLRYPGKVVVLPSGRLVVADSGHHRVLVLEADGRTATAVGSGLEGHADGSLDAAAFCDPQGIAAKSETEFYVADARAHTIRRVDLAKRVVETIAGTGELGDAPLRAARDAGEVALRSPWDVALVRGADGIERLYIALAGSHQIAVYDFATKKIAPVAGTGAESIVDGPGLHATFSQPSGLAFHEGVLYVADSETSAVRAVDVATREVRTVMGAGLFDFGDIDGPRERARMQHDIGIGVAPDGTLVVCDTYNHKLKVVDRRTGATRTLYGAGDLAEPAGVAWDVAASERGHKHGGRACWVVADTNHHRIVRIGQDGTWLEEVRITGAPAPKEGRIAPGVTNAAADDADWFTLHFAPDGGAALAPGDVTLDIPLYAPAGKKFAEGSRLDVSVEVSRRSDLLVPERDAYAIEASGRAEERLALRARVVPFDAESIESEVVLRAVGVVCSADVASAGAVCEPFRMWIRVPVRLARSGVSRVSFRSAPAV